eukprot:CAMPEP_0119548172 /NCGR_PEP_ID=MMETSP1352-20130426/2153_1 /TAXON_ID=265584 /ORGANISM="Stauroneis constricta, Strain CCMP1120" /LENGTH=82 /DNA_ID=CAMNT_0007593361 /DNA_START=653 /DNA_END=902 /DNA_ORIENTATION=-
MVEFDATIIDNFCKNVDKDSDAAITCNVYTVRSASLRDDKEPDVVSDECSKSNADGADNDDHDGMMMFFCFLLTRIPSFPLL